MDKRRPRLDSACLKDPKISFHRILIIVSRGIIGEKVEYERNFQISEIENIFTYNLPYQCNWVLCVSASGRRKQIFSRFGTFTILCEGHRRKSMATERFCFYSMVIVWGRMGGWHRVFSEESGDVCCPTSVLSSQAFYSNYRVGGLITLASLRHSRHFISKICICNRNTMESC